MAKGTLNFSWAFSPPRPCQSKRQDLIKFQIQGGQGTGRYSFELGTSPVGQDGVFDTETQQIRPLDQFGFFVAYYRWWTNRIGSQFVYGQERVSNLDIQNDDDFARSTYVLANLAFRAFDRMDLVLEWNYGERYNKDGQKGYANRFMIVINYGF